MGRVASSTRFVLRAGAALVTLAAALFALWAAPVAHADNELVSSQPEKDAQLDSSPNILSLTFRDPIGSTSTIVASCNKSPLPIGNSTVSPDRLTLTAQVVNPMPPGTCVVSARVSATDGTPNGSVSFSFTITGTAVPVATEATTPTGTDVTATTVKPKPTTPTSADSTPVKPARVGGPLGLSRLVASIGLAGLLGSLVLIVMAWPEGVEYILTVRFVRAMWFLGFVGSVLTAVFLTAQVTGRSVGASLSPATWLDLKDSTPGKAVLARVALAAASLWAVIRPERSIDPGTQLPSLGLPILAVATYGFARPGGDLAILGFVVGVGHALAMSVWVGGLLLLSRVVLAGPGDEDLVHAVRGFSRLATPALLLTVITGAVMTFRLDRGRVFDSSHGRVLLLKVLVVAGMVFIGMITRQFVRTRLDRVDTMTAPLAGRLRRAAGVEALGGVVTLGLTAWLMSFVPAGLVITDAAHASYAYRQGHVVDGDLDVTVSLTGVVGPNGVRVDVAKPATGLRDLTITFVPPEGSGASTVVLTLPPGLNGAGAAELDVAEGVPLSAAGVWTMKITASTSGTAHDQQKAFTLPVVP